MSVQIDNVFVVVAEFIEQETGFRSANVRPETTLLRDLGLDGDDAEQFFLSFGKRFGVSLAGLNLSKHFGGEGFPCANVLGLPVKLIGSVTKNDVHEQSGLQPIRVECLVQAVKLKRWSVK